MKDILGIIIFFKFSNYEKINILEVGTFDGKFANFYPAYFQTQRFTLWICLTTIQGLLVHIEGRTIKREQFIIITIKDYKKKYLSVKNG